MIHHHPSPEILSDYARGALTSGMMLVVACHVLECTVCRSEVGLWNSVGGAMLDTFDPVSLKEGALVDVLSRLDIKSVQVRSKRPRFLRSYSIPASLLRRQIGPRRWVTPNIWFAPVKGDLLTYLVFARRNTMLSFHTHGGREFTQVLEGVFEDTAGRFGIGDFAETNESVEHAPKATSEGSCLCLISSETPMQLKYRPARIIQSLLGKQY
ncbi:MAG: ChrR family anti-sigma-E factor [Rhizomicrobium sp.]